MAAPLGSLLATVLLSPSAGEYAQQLKNGIFVFALSSGDMRMRLEGCSSSLFQLVFRQVWGGISLPENGSGPEHCFLCSMG